MKRVLIFALLPLAIAAATPANVLADGKSKKAVPVKAAESAKEPAEIHWITSFEELQAKMQKSPRKVFVDVYTGWCGWCKKMDASTFSNPELIKYVNNNYYAFKLDAERKDTIHFNGKTYYFEPNYKSNTIAVEWLQGKLSYPTSVLMMENFQNPTPIPGYHPTTEMEFILSYFGDNAYKHQKWDEYQKAYHPTWDHGGTPDMAPPAGH